MIEFCMVCGLSGSGKTTFAHQFDNDYLVIDSDEMRERLLGDASDQSQNALVFNEMFRITKQALKMGQSVMYVATNLIMKRRIALLQQLRRAYPEIKYRCVVINTLVDECRARNSARSRVVPAFVIDKQLKQFQFPVESEGWDKIEIVDSVEYDIKKLTNKIWKDVKNFGSQDNPYHTLTLYDHLLHCINELKFESVNEQQMCELLLAAGLHDIGKAYTRFYDENHIAHYYGHECVSAYLAMNMKVPTRAIQLISYHMHMYDSKTINIWRNRLGEDIWKELIILHNADCKAR